MAVTNKDANQKVKVDASKDEPNVKAQAPGNATAVDPGEERPVPVQVAPGGDRTSQRVREVLEEVHGRLNSSNSPNLPTGDVIPTAAVKDPQPPHPLAPLVSRPNADDTPNSEARQAIEDKEKKQGNFAEESK